MNVNTLDYSIDFDPVYLWQYNYARKFLYILKGINNFFDVNVTGFWEKWYNDVYNIDTATTFGLNVWGEILGVQRPYQNPENFHLTLDDRFQLFNPTTGKWYTVVCRGLSTKVAFAVEATGSPLDAPDFVDDETYRTYLKGRMFLYGSNGSMYDINKYLTYIFPSQSVYAINNLDMSISVIFYSTLTKRDLALLNDEGFLPLPAGVELKIVQADPNNTWGWEGQNLNTFNDDAFDGQEPSPDWGKGIFYQ